MLFVFDPWGLMLSDPHFQTGHDDVVVIRVLDEHGVTVSPCVSGQSEGGGLMAVAARPPNGRSRTNLGTAIAADMVDHLIERQAEVVSLVEALDQREVSPGEV